uniref:Potassium channel domain-containing protein n=1 Tax=Romanomermis culicivorax TaxID=13658 RepID=A0A915IWS5_ROMCU
MIPLIRFEYAGKVWERIKILSPHVGFVLILIVYLCIGSIVFGLIEKPNAKKCESENRRLVAKKQRELLIKIDRYKMDGRTLNEAQKEFDSFIREIYKIYKKNGSKFLYSINDGDGSWNFMQAFFFGLTTILSIGYGADVPVTFQGRIFCLIFVVIGLPLTMVTLANVAKFLSQLITWIYTCSLIKFSKLTDRFYQILDRVSESSRNSKFITRIRRNSSIGSKNCDEKMAQLLWDNLDQASVVRVPIWLMFTLILLYICLGALTFGPLENWSFAESFYFSFVSVFAVGFGDLTPKNPAYLWWACFYVLGGLVLATTCIDAVGVHYANDIHNVGRRLRRTNPIGWLKIMQEKRLRAMKRQSVWNMFQIVAAVSQVK